MTELAQSLAICILGLTFIVQMYYWRKLAQRVDRLALQQGALLLQMELVVKELEHVPGQPDVKRNIRVQRDD